LVAVVSNPDARAFTSLAAYTREGARTQDLRVEAIDITLYQSMAWVRELRRQHVEAGVVEVAFPELPNTQSESTEVRAVDDLGVFRVLSLDYPNERAAAGGPGRTAIARVETEAGDRALELSYLSSEMMWNASYTATLPADRADVTLVGYAHIVNRTRRAFPNASIRLVSGVSSNFTANPSPVPAGFSPLSRIGELPPPSPQPILEVRALNLEPATVRDGHDKLIEFMRVPGVSLAVEHSIVFSASYGSRPRAERQTAGIVAVIRNVESNGLGKALPAGSFRLITVQADGGRALMGTGHVEETKPGDVLRVPVGHDRDVTAVRWLFAYDGDRRTKRCEQTYRIRLQSRKPHDVTVELRDAASEKLLRSSHASSDPERSETAFTVTIPAQSSVEVTYTGVYRCE
jgi:hypothetical protein